TWCHGASGIVIARLTNLALAPSLEDREAAGAVLGRLLDEAHRPDLAAGEADDLCCGHSGRIDTLLQAHLLLDNPALLEGALALMRRVSERAQRAGGYSLSAARGADIFAPSLFQGIAGLGYTLLRLAEPRTLPCLLLLE
ncbi:MAG: type 2 lantipeptide synthetase LanM, partial [Acidobacteriota bacterium]|nr:type 2 lantipeptide synthetase LanM [Acidobacteriota bacterium]